MSISEKIQQLKDIEDQHKKLRNEVLEVILTITDEIGQNPATTPVGSGESKMFTMKFSDLAGKPWSPGYHDWNTQAERLVSVLEKKPVTDWRDMISEWAKGSKTDKTQVVVDKIQLNTEFLNKVLEKL